MNTLLKWLIGAAVASTVLIISSVGAETATQRFSDSRVEMPPGNLKVYKSAPGIFASAPDLPNKDSSQLILERMTLLEKKLELMDKRLSQLESEKK